MAPMRSRRRDEPLRPMNPPMPLRPPRRRALVAIVAASVLACRAREPPPRRPAHAPISTAAVAPSPAVPGAAWTSSLIVPIAAASTPLEITVHVPAHLDLRRPIHAVVFFHAATVCAAEFTWPGEFDRRLCHRSPGRSAGWGFAALHDIAHTNTVFVVPQLHSGRDGALGRAGAFHIMLDAVARHVTAHLDASAPPLRFAGTVLAAHSLGGHTLLDTLAFPDVARDVRAVLLYDTVGDRANVLLRWWNAPAGPTPRRLVIAYGGVRSAGVLARAVLAATRHRPAGTLVTRVGDLTRDLTQHPMVVMSTTLAHGFVPYPYFTKSLATLGLPTRDVLEPWEVTTPHAPTAITVGSVVEGRLLPPDALEGETRRYRDYALTLPAGACVDVTLTGGPARWEPRGMLDTRLQFFVDGARVLDDDDGIGVDAPGRERFDSRGRWCAPAATRLLVRASSRLGCWHGGAFTLSVRSEGDPQASTQ